MADIQFLRPAWFGLLLLIPLVLWLWRQGHQGGSGWERTISQRFLAPLLPNTGTPNGKRRGRGWWAALLLAIASIALAGPSWRQAPNPLEKLPDSLVVALDLSLSMLATDESPDRLTRAKQKIRDLIPARAEAYTGLVAYAGDAHVVTPLTDDSRAIENLLPALDPFMMPAMGSRADRAVATAIELLEQGARGAGSILLVTDSIDRRHHDAIQSMLAESGYRLKILGVGSPEGAPIPIPEHGFLRDEGKLITPQLEMAELTALADLTDARVSRLTLTNNDLEQLNVIKAQRGSFDASGEERRLNLQVDDGYWLIWLLVPLGLLAWRRGGLAVILIAFTLPLPETAQASGWEDLWLRPDQQGARLFLSDPKAAAEAFNDPNWRGSALYRAGEYEAAAEAFAHGEGPDADYNRGNALARGGDLEEAIAAYERVLEAQPGHEDAAANKALVETLLEQQKQKQQQNQQNSEGDGEQKQGEGNQSKNQGSPGESGQSGANGNTPSNSSPSGDQGPDTEAGEDGEPGEEGDPQPADDQTSQDQAQEGKGLLSDPDAQDARSREQWMRRVPDDPAGLLRRKFLYQYQQKNTDTEESQPW